VGFRGRGVALPGAETLSEGWGFSSDWHGEEAGPQGWGRGFAQEEEPRVQTASVLGRSLGVGFQRGRGLMGRGLRVLWGLCGRGKPAGAGL